MELRLIVEASDLSAHDRINLEGRNWCLTEPLDITHTGSMPSYVCVSYIWGPKREWNKHLRPGLVSDQTIPALEIAIRNSTFKAFWTDFFCVPSEGPGRQATLESMGFIYSRASEVIVVLSQATFDAIEQISKSDRLDEQNMAILEQDPWIKSVWTYQEVINSQTLTFACERPNIAPVDGQDFLSRLGYSNTLYAKSHSSDPFAIYTHYPNLNALEDLFGDWMIASYTQVPVLQVLSNLDRRSWATPQNYFYAAIGAITQEAVSWGPAGSSSLEDISETFMRLCEKKNDYSFIYTFAPRSDKPGWRWRPKSGMLLHSVLTWHLIGLAQRAHYDVEGIFWLDEMLHLPTTPHLGNPGREFITQWLNPHGQFAVVETGTSESEMVQKTRYKLQRMGFTGSSTSHLITERGLFFPHTPLPLPTDANAPTASTSTSTSVVTVLVSTGVQWVLGAPGLAALVTTNGLVSFFPGAFVGEVRGGVVGSVRMDDAGVLGFLATGERNTYMRIMGKE